jgi:hypothetical protein
MDRFPRRPSPALVLATVALVVALAGSGYAAVGLGRDTVTSHSIAPGAVRTADLANSAVTSKKIRNRSVRTVDYANGSVGSRAIRDGGVLDRDIAPGVAGSKVIGTVPSAAQATSAVRANEAASAETAASVAGVTARRVRYAPAAATGAPTTILDVGGLSVTATCAGGEVALTARSATADALIEVASTDTAAAGPVQVARDADLDLGEALALPVAGAPLVRVAYVAPGGATVTVDLAVDDGGAALGGAACAVGGTALAAP